MTDKQIIIDGVDVSGCNLYRDEVSFIGGEIITDICSIWIWQRDYKGLEPNCVMKCHCPDNPNCYYKQLKRKEQECEELKNRLKYIRGENICLKENATDEQIDYVALNNYIKTLEFQASKLKAENDTLFKAIEEVNKINKKLESENEELKEKLQKYIDKEQWEIELNKKCADGFKEMRKMLYGKFIGNSLIEKRNPYGN